MRRRDSLAALAATAWWLSGCSSVPKVSEQESALLADAPRLTGRFGLIVPAGAGGQARGQNVTANFELLGDPRRGRLEMSTPMGSLVARVSWQPGWVSLRTPDEERQYDDVESLTQELLGQALPVQALFDWLKGRPWPQAAHRPVGEQGFEQLGWQVDLRRFNDRLISAQRLNPDGGEAIATLRLKLDDTP
ncbi:outer membrane lipoprotein LolB [Roseateles amylovorans]|jgi:outer membrane lipoprotein LolB|uniref:Outer-membrane lipoprotein LolB n=1 Tax=Roseateles amylovorans TaxID=2978473 RepID=A0ABY6AXY9_9BURK|nr:outer membrane lipoprotein LolB [Roseateles amylovorans]UXH77445.1 outer membrane lipoprotein LolB [Roseateles amylovorans]